MPDHQEPLTEVQLMNEQVEMLAYELHRVYQDEAKRQGDVRHHDKYSALPENIKEFDRVLARFIIERERALAAKVNALQEMVGRAEDTSMYWMQEHDKLAARLREAEAGEQKWLLEYQARLLIERVNVQLEAKLKKALRVVEAARKVKWAVKLMDEETSDFTDAPEFYDALAAMEVEDE